MFSRGRNQTNKTSYNKWSKLIVPKYAQELAFKYFNKNTFSLLENNFAEGDNNREKNMRIISIKTYFAG